MATNKEGHSITWWNSNGPVTCGRILHEGTAVGTTVASIEFAPVWEEGCLTVAAGTTASTEQTMHVVCPAGKVLELNQGGTCLVTMPPQIAGNAATYTTTETNGKHAITVDMHATLETQFHGGVCVFLAQNSSRR